MLGALHELIQKLAFLGKNKNTTHNLLTNLEKLREMCLPTLRLTTAIWIYYLYNYYIKNFYTNAWIYLEKAK